AHVRVPAGARDVRQLPRRVRWGACECRRPTGSGTRPDGCGVHATAAGGAVHRAGRRRADGRGTMILRLLGRSHLFWMAAATSALALVLLATPFFLAQSTGLFA